MHSYDEQFTIMMIDDESRLPIDFINIKINEINNETKIEDLLNIIKLKTSLDKLKNFTCNGQI